MVLIIMVLFSCAKNNENTVPNEVDSNINNILNEAEFEFELEIKNEGIIIVQDAVESQELLNLILYAGDISELEKSITMEQLEFFSRDDLRILRNTIYARYGYRFNSKDLQEHFSKFAWYNGVTNNVDNKLTAVDIGNIELVQRAEQNYSEKNYSTNVSIGNAYLDMSSQMYDDLLFILDRNNMENFFRNVYFDSEKEARNSINYTILAIDLYNQSNYEASIDNLILARKANRREYGLVYYYLGLCLMAIDSLELAERSFEHTIEFFFNRDLHWGVISPWGEELLFSCDNNNVKREPYFAFYYIACIESLRNNIDSAFRYLCEALYHGYPYIDHIRNDPYLRNLFMDRRRLQEIERIYNAGSQNNLIGKYFDVFGIDSGSGYTQYIYFRDQRTIEVLIDNYEWYRYEDETYEIKNYTVFSEAFFWSYHYYETYVRRFEGLDYHGVNYREIRSGEFHGYGK
jgi:hypothetical protein